MDLGVSMHKGRISTKESGLMVHSQEKGDFKVRVGTVMKAAFSMERKRDLGGRTFRMGNTMKDFSRPTASTVKVKYP